MERVDGMKPNAIHVLLPRMGVCHIEVDLVESTWYICLVSRHAYLNAGRMRMYRRIICYERRRNIHLLETGIFLWKIWVYYHGLLHEALQLNAWVPLTVALFILLFLHFFWTGTILAALEIESDRVWRRLNTTARFISTSILVCHSLKIPRWLAKSNLIMLSLNVFFSPVAYFIKVYLLFPSTYT